MPCNFLGHLILLLYTVCHGAQLEGCRGIFEEGTKLLGGRLDALVNNAGKLASS